MDNKPLLSIVIPTRNREKYCIEAIRNILSYQEDCFELVIQDNSDSDDIENYIKTHSDRRLRYNRVKGRVNSVLNIRASVDFAEGEYVCMIGDDDTILPNLFAIVRWAKANNVKAITPKNNPAFFWNHDGTLNGKLITQPTRSRIEWARPDERIAKLMKGGIIDYQQYCLPRLYHGLIRTDVLDMIRKKTGHVIGGLSPDIYLAISSSFYIDEYIITDFPISVQGACVQSTSVGNPRGKFEDMPHLWNRGEYHWDILIPKYNSSQTIWAETALKAIDENGMSEKYRPLFDLHYFLTAFRLENKDRKGEIDMLVGKAEKVPFMCYVRYYYSFLIIMKNALLKRIGGGRREYEAVESWDGVMQIIGKKCSYL